VATFATNDFNRVLIEQTIALAKDAAATNQFAFVLIQSVKIGIIESVHVENRCLLSHDSFFRSIFSCDAFRNKFELFLTDDGKIALKHFKPKNRPKELRTFSRR